MIIKIGTRGSLLAMAQAELVKSAITSYFSELSVEIIKITTSGDVITDKPLYDVGGKGLFIKEVEEALLNCRVDIAVHSVKDVPAFYSEGLDIPCVLQRGSVFDVLVSLKYKSLDLLPVGVRIGTSSLRRKVQLLAMRPDLKVVPIRGNVDTRISKVHTGELDGIILAEAGLERILRQEVISEVLSPDVMLGAVGQGAICVQCRKDDKSIASMLGHLNNRKSFTEVTAERSFMRAVEGSCRTPLAALAKYVSTDFLSMKCMLADDDGFMVFLERTFPEVDAAKVGFEMGTMLKNELTLRKE